MKIFQLFPATEWRTKAAHGETVGFVVKTSRAPERGESFFRRSIFCRPIRGLNLFPANNPTVSSWATFFRASGALTAVILFFAVGATAETTNTLSNAEIQGRNLAQQLCDAQPEESFTNTGVLQIRNGNGSRTNLIFHGQVTVTESNWSSLYYVTLKSESGIPDSISVSIISSRDQSHEYFHTPAGACIPAILQSSETMIPFAGSDFWLCDLGLEFFHWPQQTVLPKTTPLRRGRSYTLLESTNPNPATNSYSRVRSWIDKESGGILEAEAYDINGRLLKVFEPKSFKKVNGQWQLQEMEIRNVQTGSRTRLDFDLKPE